MAPEEKRQKPTFGFDAFELADRLLDEDASELRRPSDFGPYRFLDDEPIGAGALGEVWLAEEHGVDRRVAIKILRQGARPDLASGEVRNQGKLEHPNIARLYNRGQLEDGTFWLAMEYVKGQPLDLYCRERGLSLAARIRLFRGICEAVQYAHSEMVFHGDLKPSNILVKEGDEPKLLDFGLAQRLQKTDDGDEKDPLVLGFTPAYAPPEQFRGKSSGFRSDIYSLGTIFYELLTGVLPFDASNKTLSEIGASKSNELPKLPSASLSVKHGRQIGRVAWRDLDAICLKAMHPIPNLRYSSVEALIQDLDAYVNCEPVAALQPHSRTYLLRKFVGRNRRALILATSMLAVVAGLAGFYTVRLAQERNRAIAEAARTRRIQRFMIDLFQNGDQQAAPSKDLTVLAALDRGAQSASSLKSDPETQAGLYLTMGTLYELLNRYPKASEFLERSLETFRATGAGNPKTVGALVQLGLLRGDQNRFSDAQKLIQQGLDLAARLHLGPDSYEMLDARSALGRVLVQSGSPDKAIALLQPIVDRPPRNEEEQIVQTESLTALAVAQQYAGHYDVAESLNRRALALDRKLHGESYPRVATDLANIATAQLTRGQYAEAEKLYREAENIFEHWYGEDGPDTVQLKSFIALAAMQQGRNAEAEQLLRNVLPLEERAYGTSVHATVAFTYDMLGKVALLQRNLPEAEANFSRSLEIDTKLFGEKEYKTAVAASDLAGVLVKERQFERAEKIARPAVSALTARPLPGNMSVGAVQLNLGEALLGQKRYRDAEAPIVAAHAILTNQPVAFKAKLDDSRRDLVIIYTALKEPDKAEQYRAELAAPGRGK